MSRWTRILLITYIALTTFLLVIGMPILVPSLRYRLNAEEKDYLSNLEIIHAVGDRAFPPFSFLSATGPAGFERDLVLELEKVLGVQILLNQTEWPEARRRLASGEAAFITGMSVTDQRKSLYIFSEPLLLNTYLLITPAFGSVRSLEDLTPDNIVVAQASSATYEMAESLGLNLRAVVSPEEALSVLRSGGADAWLEYQWAARHLLGQREPMRWRLATLEGVVEPYALALSHDADQLLVQVLNKGLLRLRDEGTMAELQARWFGPAIQQVTDTESQYRNFLLILFLVVSSGGGILAYNIQLHRQVNQKTRELTSANLLLSDQQLRLRQLLVNTARALGTAIEVKDKYTGGHSQRVARVSMALAQRMGFDAGAAFDIFLGALIHDIGKVGVPDLTLTKKDRLTDEEMAQVRQHPQIGNNILRNVDGFDHIREIVLHHHERWDGQVAGSFPAYPGVCLGHDIPLGARIVSVADAYDAMTSDRPYRAARTVDEALQELQNCAGKQFDPEIVEAMCSMESELKYMQQSAMAEQSPLPEPIPEEI